MTRETHPEAAEIYKWENSVNTSGREASVEEGVRGLGSSHWQQTLSPCECGRQGPGEWLRAPAGVPSSQVPLGSLLAQAQGTKPSC